MATKLDLPPDFAERCHVTNAAIEAGVPMTMEHIADQLGIPYEFFAAAVALQIALRDNGCTVVVDTAPARQDG